MQSNPNLQLLLDELNPSQQVVMVDRKALLDILGEEAQQLIPPLPEKVAVNVQHALFLLRNHVQDKKLQSKD